MNETRPRRKLLVVEDNAVISVLVQKGIGRSKLAAVEVLVAGDGREGIAAARQHRPDAVLLDWMMPGFDGQYFLENQAADPAIAATPVLVHSALKSAELKEVLSKFPSVKAHIAKPLVPSKLFEILAPFIAPAPSAAAGAPEANPATSAPVKS